MYMNENSQPGFGKISVHGDGVGAPTPELTEQRAREIALIDERDPDDFTDADWEQARRELMGIPQTAAPEEIASGVEVSEDEDRKSTRLNSSHANISYAVFCLK